MRSEFELDRTDYHLRLMIEQMQRDGRSEGAIESAVLDRIGPEATDREAGAHGNRTSRRSEALRV